MRKAVDHLAADTSSQNFARGRVEFPAIGVRFIVGAHANSLC